jgi:hypothetical protein
VTYSVTPVTQRARSDERKRPERPTSSAYRSWGRGALAYKIAQQREVRLVSKPWRRPSERGASLDSKLIVDRT